MYPFALRLQDYEKEREETYLTWHLVRKVLCVW